MAAGVKITGGDKLLTKLEKMRKKFGKHRVTAGFYPDRKYPANAEEGRKNAIPVAQVAYWNNFGTTSKDGGEFIPPRPFFSDAVDENRQKWIDGLGKMIVKSDYDAQKALTLTGEEMQSDIMEKIKVGGYAPNSKITIEGLETKSKNGKTFKIGGKGTDHPLIDTHHMEDSVGYAVDNESPHYRKGGQF